jgi:hypothetical protein
LIEKSRRAERKVNMSKSEEEQVHKNEEHPVFNYTVDGETQTTTEHVMTPINIMSKAGVDPNTHYLVQMIGTNKKSYKDNPNEEIHMHNHMTFFTNDIGPTPVS